ncbi:MAG: aldo/keto reductase [Verrucomicrobia bacterium]|nr:aldo/keto reductase [Verrucomicrobiota bacterium]
MKRRTFLKAVGGAAGLAAVGVNTAFAKETAGGMPQRVLGRTGVKVSIVGFPGLGLTRDTQEDCTKAVQDAFKRGVNYFDVAPAYGKDGICETKMGIALQGLGRRNYFLACKTKARDKAGARAELERSLQRLKTDYFDLYQLHHLVKPDDAKTALGPGGAMETILEAKKEGKVRAIGFSAHTTKAALEALRGFKFDTAMFPISYVEYFTRDFAKAVMELAREKGTALLSIKTMNAGAWPQGAQRTRQWWYRSLEDQEEINMAWRWTLSLPGVVTGFPPAWLDLVDKAIEAGHAFRPVTDAETKKLQEMAAGQGSIFKREEDLVALGRPHDFPYPHHPHECCAGEMA